MADGTLLDLAKAHYAEIANHYDENPSDVAEFDLAEAGFSRSGEEAIEILDRFVRGGDAEQFRAGLQAWATKPDTLAFNGPSGMMLVGQICRRTADSAQLAALLDDVFRTPETIEQAEAKLAALIAHFDTIQQSGQPSAVSAPFLCSYFWGLQDRTRRWPVYWSSAVSFLTVLTGTQMPKDPVDRYARYVQTISSISDDQVRFLNVARWWESSPVRVADSTSARAEWGSDESRPVDAREQNARALEATGQAIASRLLEPLTEVVGQKLRKSPALWSWTPDRPRADMRADWLVHSSREYGLRVWQNQHGAVLGLRLASEGEADVHRLEAACAAHPVDRAVKVLTGSSSVVHVTDGVDKGFVGGWPGAFVYGRWFDRSQLGEVDLMDEMTRFAHDARPLLDSLLEPAAASHAPSDGDASDVAQLVARFKTERTYPTAADTQNIADRREFAEALSPAALPEFDLPTFRQIISTKRFGNPGSQSILNTSLRDADADELTRIAGSLDHLLWGDGDVADRIDQLLTDSDIRVRGLGESVMMKLLAIVQPERFLPVFPTSGDSGKKRFVASLGLDEPEALTAGELQIATNQALFDALEPHFGGDTYAMGRFLYWTQALETDAAAQADVEERTLASIANELHVDESFLDEVVALLKRKKQVIFYGPPGTGKTFLARKLASYLAPNPDHREVVQFHPSTSYEDFFEGYRPDVDEQTGVMTYQLQPGPLARMADAATLTPGQRRVMVIDEINRANIAKVMGELLYLLEYRDEPIKTLYRPTSGFELPDDIWFIGTMNTADRSIALIDAALRRRFHFVPFFPSSDVLADVLPRWLDATGRPAWFGRFVAYANAVLVDKLGGPDLQIGHSYFIVGEKEDLDEATFELIWKHDIEPLIEDQFFGDAAAIASFRFARLKTLFEKSELSDGDDADIDE